VLPEDGVALLGEAALCDSFVSCVMLIKLKWSGLDKLVCKLCKCACGLSLYVSGIWVKLSMFEDNLEFEL
jgi:hypothetical protein